MISNVTEPEPEKPVIPTVIAEDPAGLVGMTDELKGSMAGIEAPLALPANNVQTYSFRANWQAVTGATKYKIWVTGQDINTQDPLSFYGKDAGTATYCDVTGLRPGSHYRYYVQALVGSDGSVSSNGIDVYTISLAPIAYDGTNVTGSSFIANWSKVYGEYYYLWVYEASNEAEVPGYNGIKVYNKPGTGIYMQVTGLKPQTTYKYMVTAVNNKLQSALSNVKEVTTGATAAGIHDVNLNVAPSVGGVVFGTGKYFDGQTITIYAEPAEELEFVNWTEDGTVLSTRTDYSFNVTKDRVITANFRQKQIVSCYLTAFFKPDAGGSVTGGGDYNFGAGVVVRAVPNAGYDFLYWTENGRVVSKSAEYSFNIGQDRTLMAHFRLKELGHLITLEAEPAEGGKVSGGGGAYDFQNITINAVANAGYSFVSWREGGTVLSTQPSYSFYVAGSGIVTAYFSKTTNTNVILSVPHSPVEGGNCSYSDGAGSYPVGTYIAAIATPNENYMFQNWTENGTVISTDYVYATKLMTNRTITANFAPLAEMFDITLSASEGGSVSGGGSFEAGTSVTVVASPYKGYQFVNWTENGKEASKAASYTFTVTRDCSLKANFIAQTDCILGVAPNPLTGGVVTGDGTFTSGTSVTVNASANPGYTFGNWTEGGNQVSTSDSYTFTINANTSLIANFTQNPAAIYVLSLLATQGGTVSGTGAYVPNAGVTAVATPNKGYEFVSWTENGKVVSSSANYTFSITASRNLVANFQLSSTTKYTISLSSSPFVGGSVTGGGSYSQGTSVTVTATASNGYAFESWTENGSKVSNTASYTFTVNGDRTLVANFTQQTQTLTLALSASPAVGGTVSGGGSYNAGTSVTAVATAASGYEFVNWTEGGVSVSSSASYTFTISVNRTLVANFRQQTQMVTLALSSSPAAGGTVSGGGSYNAGTSVTAVATAVSGYEFVNWTEGGVSVSSSASYTFTISVNRTLVANFRQQTQMVTLALSASPAAGGTVSGGGSYNAGTSVTAVATAASGYDFVNWTEGGVGVSTSANYTFTLSAGRTLTANFTLSTGVGDIASQSVHVYPNPATLSVFIKGADDGTVYSVFSVIGEKVMTGKVTSQEQVVPVGHLTAGIYYIAIETENRITTIKLIKK